MERVSLDIGGRDILTTEDLLEGPLDGRRARSRRAGNRYDGMLPGHDWSSLRFKCETGRDGQTAEHFSRI